MLDILEVLSSSLSMNPNLESASRTARIPNTTYDIQFMESMEAREAIVRNYAERCKGIIQEAMKWAPKTTRSHLQEYIINLNCASDHSGLAMATEELFKSSGLNNSPFIGSLTLRNHYLGQVRGMLQIEKMSNLVTLFGDQGAGRSDETFQENIWLSTSLLICHEGLNKSLLHKICWAPVQRFTENVLKTCVQCWQWLLSAKKEFTLEFMQELLVSWQTTIDRKLGLFQSIPPTTSPLSYYEGCNDLKLQLPNISPHDIWTSFICNLVQNNKGCDDDLVEMFLYLIYRTFPLTAGVTTTETTVTSHILALRPKLRLLSCALTLLQDDSTRHSNLKKSIIRERIYASCLDYFCQDPSVPHTETPKKLEKDLQVVIKFWKILHLDKKYIGSLKIKRRNLILELLATEIDILMTWYNPLNKSELAVIEGLSTIAIWHSKKRSQEYWRDLVRLAWDLSPTLAVYLPQRLKYTEKHAITVKDELTHLVQIYPDHVMHIPEALNYLVTPSAILEDNSQLSAILTWVPCSPIQALSYFSPRHYPSHPITAQYTVKTLLSIPTNSILNYIPQLVQCLRQDAMGYVREFIKKIAKNSQLLAHQLIWNMKTNIYLDEEGHQRDPQIGDTLELLIKSIVESLTGSAKCFYEREFTFFDKITGISGEIRRYPKGLQRKQACLRELSKIRVEHGCYLPSNPEALIINIDGKSGNPMQSAAKAPFLARFKVKKCGISQVENVGLGGGGYGELGEDEEVWQAAIFKVGDDVRQDMLALQVISLFKNIFERVGLDLYLFPYRVVATAPGSGVIECVPNAKSREQLGRQTDVTLYDYFKRKYGEEDTLGFQNARRKFIRSMVAYSVIGFILQIKDRHNGNIMVDEEGHVIHIDFGFMFESSPGGNLGFEPDIKLTEEMVMIMGGNMDASPFQWFMQLCVNAYLAVRPYCESIVSLVSLMLDTGLPCFRGDQTIHLLRQRFKPEISEREAAQFMINVINNSFLSFRTKTYDMIQYYQNQIPY